MFLRRKPSHRVELFICLRLWYITIGLYQGPLSSSSHLLLLYILIFMEIIIHVTNLVSSLTLQSHTVWTLKEIPSPLYGFIYSVCPSSSFPYVCIWNTDCYMLFMVSTYHIFLLHIPSHKYLHYLKLPSTTDTVSLYMPSCKSMRFSWV